MVRENHGREMVCLIKSVKEERLEKSRSIGLSESGVNSLLMLGQINLR